MVHVKYTSAKHDAQDCNNM